MPRKRKPRAKPVPRKVTHRQQAFAREYLVDYNGTQAAIRAGYSKKGAAQQASALLRLPKVIEELAKRAAPVKKRAELKASELLEVMQLVAYGDVSNLFKPSSGNGSVSTIKDMRELGEDQVLVAGYKRGSDGSVELKFENWMRAREAPDEAPRVAQGADAARGFERSDDRGAGSGSRSSAPRSCCSSTPRWRWSTGCCTRRRQARAAD